MGFPVALLDDQPRRLESILPIKFERTRDDLDDLDGALLLSDRGTYFVLIYHLHAPQKGVQIVINEKAENAEADLNEALRVMAPAAPRLLWRHPSLKN